MTSNVRNVQGPTLIGCNHCPPVCCAPAQDHATHHHQSRPAAAERSATSAIAPPSAADHARTCASAPATHHPSPPAPATPHHHADRPARHHHTSRSKLHQADQLSTSDHESSCTARPKKSATRSQADGPTPPRRSARQSHQSCNAADALIRGRSCSGLYAIADASVIHPNAVSQDRCDSRSRRSTK